jgi:asparagine synthase (glutamine-hydrolysing)
MCGIVGKLNFASDSPVSRPEIEAMMRPLTHRGPDGHGVHLDGPVGLGHLRLAIIDVDGGPQPMTNEDGTIWIVFNGEIYNFQSLRSALLARGHQFRSRSDTEVIVHAYEEYGDDCVQHLRGMFAFAIWDAKKRRLFIARDRVGIKPLYYCQTGKSFYFASELKAIIADPAVAREVNIPGLRQFFSFYYLPGEETLFTSIRKLAPGHHLVLENGKTTIQRYWDLQFTQHRYDRTFEEVVEELRGLLGDTVHDHMIADVPVGVLLSGGVDSSAVLNFAVQGTNKKVKAFTIGFDGNQVVDERPFARMAARRFGAEHYELSITAEDFWSFLPEYVWHMEEPVCEPPAVALHYISSLARQHVKVVLSGEGGDEAFAGYPNYPNMLRLEKLQRKLGPLSRPAGTAAGLLAGLFGKTREERYAYALGRPLSQHYFSRASGPTTSYNQAANRFFSPEFLAASSAKCASNFIAKLLRPVENSPLLDQMLYADTKTWLPDDLLVKADKITMASSLELRVPLLDHKVLEFAASLAPEHKVQGMDTKRALKAVFAKVLPDEILTRKKVGFPVPYSRWLSGPLSSRVREVLLSEKARSRSYYNFNSVEKLLEKHERTNAFPQEVFSLLVVEFWHRKFTDSNSGASI